MSNISETLQKEINELKNKKIDKDKVTAEKVLKSVIK